MAGAPEQAAGPAALGHTGAPVSKDAKHKRLRVMMENAATYSDVEFRVGAEGRGFLGLKAIFARSSEVFAKMFFEAGFREQGGGPMTVVQVSDLLPEAFEQLHLWVYDMDVVLSWDTVFGVLDAARKYMVEDLELYCRRWIAAAARCPDGAAGAYAVAAAGWPRWAEVLVGRVESFSSAALASSSLCVAPLEALRELVESPDFGIQSETQVLEATRFWCEAAPSRGEDPEEAWRAAVEAELVRFPLLEPRVFAERVVLPGLLGREESLSIFLASALGEGNAREASLLGHLRAVLCTTQAEDASRCIDAVVDLRGQEGYPRALAHCLVERALMDPEQCVEWVEMWSELWGALRAAGLRDECVRATVDHCQNLFEDDPPPDSLVGVWVCPEDTLALVRILCRLNVLQKLAVLPLTKVLEVLITRAESGVHSLCMPNVAAAELVAYLEGVASRCKNLVSLQSLPDLKRRLAATDDAQ